MVRFEGGHPVNDPENEPIEDGWYYTVKEVAKMLSISQSYISRIEKKVIKDIKCEIL